MNYGIKILTCNNDTRIDQILNVMLNVPHLLAHGYQTLFNKLYIYSFLYEKEFGNGDDVQKRKMIRFIHTIAQYYDHTNSCNLLMFYQLDSIRYLGCCIANIIAEYCNLLEYTL